MDYAGPDYRADNRHRPELLSAGNNIWPPRAVANYFNAHQLGEQVLQEVLPTEIDTVFRNAENPRLCT